MGGKNKKSKKKDPETKARLAAQKEAKALKSQVKREQKTLAAESGGETLTSEIHDIDALLASYALDDLKLTTTQFEISHQQPSPRANFSFTLINSSGNKCEIIMFGGEYYNGVENVIYDELYLLTLENKAIKHWKKITTPHPRPPGRCSHQALVYRDELYILGGELVSGDQFHHYKDMWKLDLKTFTWTEVISRNKTTWSARSGHRCVVWRNYLLLFGGFFETALKDTRWFNDLHVYSFATNTWLEVPYSTLATLPPPRSACSFAVDSSTDTAFIFGGFSKLKSAPGAPGAVKSEVKIHTDSWSLNLQSLPKVFESTGAKTKSPTWEKLSRKGAYPSPRSGVSTITHKNRLVIFGGVKDDETDNQNLASIFYDDLLAMDMSRRRWFELQLKPKSNFNNDSRKFAKTTARQETKEEEDSNDSHSDDDDDDDALQELSKIKARDGRGGWDIQRLKSNISSYIDASGKIVYETVNSNKIPFSSARKVQKRRMADYSVGSSEEEEEEKDEEDNLHRKGAEGASPLPRINAGITLKGNTLFIYGGLLEVGNREVSMDDFWCIDLNKRESWECILEGTMQKQVWKGDNDDDSSVTSGESGTLIGDEDDEEEEEVETEAVVMDAIVEETAIVSGEEEEEEDTKKPRSKTKKKKTLIKEEIRALNEKYQLDDENQTPFTHETLTEFYTRTACFWTKQAEGQCGSREEDNNSSTSNTDNKELKKIGFDLAKIRFDNLADTMDRLREIELILDDLALSQKKSKSSDHKKSKKSKKKMIS